MNQFKPVAPTTVDLNAFSELEKQEVVLQRKDYASELKHKKAVKKIKVAPIPQVGAPSAKVNTQYGNTASIDEDMTLGDSSAQM